MARYFDMLRDTTEAENQANALRRLDGGMLSSINQATDIRNLPVQRASTPLEEQELLRAGFVNNGTSGEFISPTRNMAIQMQQYELAKRQAREALYDEQGDSTLFKIGDTLADTARAVLSPLLWLSGEDPSKYDPSAVRQSGYREQLDASLSYTNALYAKSVAQAAQRVALREANARNDTTMRNQNISSQFAGMSDLQKQLYSYAQNSGPENQALYKAGTSEAFNQLNKNMMLATDQAIPLFGADGSQIIVPKMMNDTFNKYGTRFEQSVGPAIEAFAALDKLRAALNEGTPLAEVAAVTQFNKVLDPGSVVREAEVKLTAEARGVYDELMIKLNNVAEGDVLSNDQVIDMLSLADKLGAVYQSVYNNVRDDAEFKFTNSGYGDQNVITQYLGSRKSFEAPTTDSIGTITVSDPAPIGSGQGPLRPEFLDQIEPSEPHLFQNDIFKYYQ